jgi:hypothetical protein
MRVVPSEPNFGVFDVVLLPTANSAEFDEANRVCLDSRAGVHTLAGPSCPCCCAQGTQSAFFPAAFAFFQRARAIAAKRALAAALIFRPCFASFGEVLLLILAHLALAAAAILARTAGLMVSFL